MNNPDLLTAVFKHAIDGIVVIDEQGMIRIVNPAVCNLFGYRPDELIGQNISLLMAATAFGQQNDCLHHHQHTGVPAITGKDGELNGRKKDGSFFPFRLTVSGFVDDGQTFYAGILHDLSMQRQIESSLSLEKKLNQVKTRLVSIASHEFRSPLSRIQLSASLVERYYERLDKERIMGHLRKIKIAVEDMTDILNDFLSIERIEAGNMQPDNRPFDLAALADELAEQMRPLATSGLQIIHKHTGTCKIIPLDRTLLRHCLVNLLSNALKYSKENGIVEFVTAISAAKCTIIIKDQGIGIPENDQPRLFNAFFRAGNTADIQGTGLGLNIVKNYISLMGGNITFKSQEHKGTSFTLTFNFDRQLVS